MSSGRTVGLCAPKSSEALFFAFCVGIALQLTPGRALASGNPPVVDAGPSKVIALPAHDLTLFGHATDPENDQMRYTWSQVSGPGGATFSAPYGLATTVRFSQTGTYTFRLTVSDGTNSVTADTTSVVLGADSQTAFYVDPTYTGGSSDGSAAHPWATLATGASGAQWTAINKALATNNVIVYFSARTAGSDLPEVEHNSEDLWRTDTSTHRLTLDGMSMYNANDASPSWLAYTGTSRFQIAITSGSLSIGVQNTNNAYPMNSTTIRGFDLSGGSGRALIAGNATVFEFNYVHDVTTTGATVQFQPAVKDYPDCTALFGNLKDITFRGNDVERGEGESFYIAGTYTREVDGGCLSWGNTHSDILIENNTIGEAGANGGEHDGIDLKAGLTWVTIRGNTIRDRPTGTKGIVALGVFWSGTSCCVGHYVIEDNVFRNSSGGVGMMLQKMNGAVIRNNISNGGGTFSTNGNDTTDYWTSQQVQFYNNTMYGNAGQIAVLYANNVLINNNLLFGTTSGYSTIQGNSTATNVTEDYNLYDTAPAQVTSGGHSLVVSSTTGLVVDAASGNFQLPSGSLANGRGLNLAYTGFAADIRGTLRQAVDPWDIGAYAFRLSTAPAPPTNLRVIR